MSKNKNNLKASIEGDIKRALLSSGANASDSLIREFILAEGFLYFCYNNGLRKDYKNLYGLLSNLHKMGKNQLDTFHFYLDNLRNKYYSLSSETYYNDIINKYLKAPVQIRMYDIQNDSVVFCGDLLDLNNRQAYYFNLINELPVPNNAKIKYDHTLKSYYFIYNDSEIKISLEDIDIPSFDLKYGRDKKGGSFTISTAELLQAANEMDLLVEEKIKQGAILTIQNYEKRLEKVTVKAVEQGMIKETSKITIDGMCNIMGMVGAGKSTIMQVLAFYAAKRGYRMCIVFETVREVLEISYILEELGMKVTPIRGETTIDDQIEKVLDGEEMFISDKYSKHLTGVCTIDGFIGRQNTFTTIDYGKEPCLKLMSYENKGTYLCPFYGNCPRKKDIRDIQYADIIVTNIYSLISCSSHFIKEYGRLTLIEYLLSSIDIVIFDEADKLQVILDKIFCDIAEVSKVLSNNIQQFTNEINKSIYGESLPVSDDFRAEFIFAIKYLNSIRDFIANNVTISNIERINSGKWFSGLLMTLEMHSSGEFTEILKEDLVNFNINESDIQLFHTYNSDYLLNSNVEKVMLRISEAYNLNDKQELLFRFTLTLILFEKSLYRLSDLLQRMSEVSVDNFEIPDIFRAPLRRLLKLIPTSPLGNRFGYVYDKEINDITIFRQFGIGRSIMLDFPFLRIDDKGNPMGPNVLLLSGSSWAEGSNRYHVNKPVKYILKSNDNILNFIENTEVTIVPSKFIISGNKNKEDAIEGLIKDSIRYIEKQLDHDGRILVIVNSYKQCIIAQQVLQELLPKTNILRLVSDKGKPEEGTIQRGKLNEAKNIKFDILVAPAMAVERGHNIVDDMGHSLLTSLFFMVRPMEVPRDIENIVSSLNGAIYEYSTKNQDQDVSDQIKNIKKYAYTIWNESFKNYYSIENLPHRQKKEIIVSRLILIIQIYGRLLRVVDVERIPPKLFFIDGAFGGNDFNDFNLLREIEEYLDANIKREDVGGIVEMLYGPFYRALKGGKVNV